MVRKLGELGPSVMALLQLDPQKRMTIERARAEWADILRAQLVQ